MKQEPRIDAGFWLFVSDLFRAMFDGLHRRQTVTRYILPGSKPDQDAIEFEVRITRIGKTRLPARLPPVDLPTQPKKGSR